MTAKPIPRHAELPLWQDKNTAQKQETLTCLFKDLQIYAGNSNETIAEHPNADDKRLLILAEYQKVLSRANSALIEKLKQIRPADEQERSDIAATIEFISANPNALNMNCEAGHTVGSGLVIHPESRRVLLHKHKKLGLWLQFGGHADYETDVAQVAERETKEECGLSDLQLVSLYEDISIPIDVEVQNFDQRKQIPPHYHFDLRFLFVTRMPDSLVVADGESDDFWWIAIDEALRLPDDKINASLKRLIGKADTYLKTNYTA
jgi:8-oxo-dGTP pyrophosphatase MutT (NUDIX family)